MKSLAILVAFLLISSIVSGPLALLLTRVKTNSRNLNVIRKIAVGLLALWGTLCGVQFTLAHAPLVIHLIGIFSAGISLYTVRIEFGAPRRFKGEKGLEED